MLNMSLMIDLSLMLFLSNGEKYRWLIHVRTSFFGKLREGMDYN